MKTSVYKSYDDLPLFLNAETVGKVLGVSSSSAYELMHEPGFPTLRIGSRMVVPKEQFIQWVSATDREVTPMNPLRVQRHPDVAGRFPLPNEIWQWNLKPAAFAILAYLQYRSCRKIHGVPAIRELAMRTKMSIQMAERASGRSGRPGTS